MRKRDYIKQVNASGIYKYDQPIYIPVYIFLFLCPMCVRMGDAWGKRIRDIKTYNVIIRYKA